VGLGEKRVTVAPSGKVRGGYLVSISSGLGVSMGKSAEASSAQRKHLHMAIPPNIVFTAFYTGDGKENGGFPALLSTLSTKLSTVICQFPIDWEKNTGNLPRIYVRCRGANPAQYSSLVSVISPFSA
jgi:hypothetical protein